MASPNSLYMRKCNGDSKNFRSIARTVTCRESDLSGLKSLSEEDLTAAETEGDTGAEDREDLERSSTTRDEKTREFTTAISLSWYSFMAFSSSSLDKAGASTADWNIQWIFTA